MCELFGASGGRVDRRGLLREFFSHGSDNPHGWGMALINGGRPEIVKEPMSAAKSAHLREVLSEDTAADILLAHIRLATKGGIEYNNTHPFAAVDASGREWVLEHNGTIFDCPPLASYIRKQEGDTDSERILLYLIDKLNGAEAFDPEARIKTVEELIYTAAPENKLNLLIGDGELLYVHSNYRGGLHLMADGGGIVFSTKALAGGEWEEVPLNTLFVYREGELIYTGTPHNHEFFDSEEKMRFLYLDFAGI